MKAVGQAYSIMVWNAMQYGRQVQVPLFQRNVLLPFSGMIKWTALKKEEVWSFKTLAPI